MRHIYRIAVMAVVLAVLLSTSFAVSAENNNAAPLDAGTSVFYEVEHEVLFDVDRGEDALVVYTPVRGATTGTNEYGYEVVVDDGLVVSRGGNNSEIPPKGFVVSGHNTMITWLRNNVVDGMRAEYSRKDGTVRFIYDAEGLKLAAEKALEATEDALAQAKAAFVYIDHAAAEAAFEADKQSYQTALDRFDSDADQAVFADECAAVFESLAALRNSLCDSYTVQYRGVWVRPSQRSAEDVETYVKKLHDNGINTISVEGWFANGVIMDVPEDSLFGKHPSFDYDVLQAYIDACHKYSMECHLWMPVMNIGSSLDSGYEERSVLAKKPQWLSLNQNGSPNNDSGFMMVDPANEEARAYLVDFYEYIVTNYDIDCLELDYIRYYAAGELDFGYTQAAFEGFEKEYGYGVTPTYDTEAVYWEDWKQYRCDCVTEMVKAVRDMIDRVAPEVLIAADVAPTSENAINTNYQDFPRWLEEGLIDILHPMAYADGYGEDIMWQVKNGGDTCIVATGLGVQTSFLDGSDMERQAREDNSYGAYGDFYFEAGSYLKDRAGTALKETVYRNQALAPFLDRDASIVAALLYMQGRLDDVLMPMNGVTQGEAKTLQSAIADASATIADGRIDPSALEVLRQAVNKVENEQAREALENDLYRAERITCVGYHLTREELTEPSSFRNGLPMWLIVTIGAVAVAAVAVVIAVVFTKKKQV